MSRGKMTVNLNPHEQRAFAVEVVRALRERGFEAYWAGGCVRDQLLQRTPYDYDVATSARPDEVREVFGKRRTLAIGAAFGVIAVLGPKSAGQIEVTTFRQDAAYADGRHPTSVSFSSPEEDARRRDFTINGMFYDPLTERVIDYVGGADDLRSGVVRAIGDARKRFDEDKLRMLRAIRFAAIFDFRLDGATRAALEGMASQVTVVSAERIAAELRIALVHATRARAVRLLRETGLLVAVLPEIRETASDVDESLERLREPSFSLALAVLLSAVDDREAVAQVGKRLRLTNKEIERTTWLLAHWRSLCAASAMPWSKLQPLLIAPGSDELLAFGEALDVDASELAYCRGKLQLPLEQLDPPPLLSGADLLAHGIARGPQFSRLLNAVRDAQLDGQIAGKAQALALVQSLRI